MRTRNITNGVSVGFDPKSNSTVTNNVIIQTGERTDEPVSVKAGDASITYPEPPQDTLADRDEEEVYVSRRSSTIFQHVNESTLNEYLLSIYQEVLLSDNKLLLTNLISGSKIILAKHNIEEIVRILTGLNTIVDLEDLESVCCSSSVVPFRRISSIRVGDQGQVNFKINFNHLYTLLESKYKVSLKFCNA